MVESRRPTAQQHSGVPVVCHLWSLPLCVAVGKPWRRVHRLGRDHGQAGADNKPSGSAAPTCGPARRARCCAAAQAGLMAGTETAGNIAPMMCEVARLMCRRSSTQPSSASRAIAAPMSCWWPRNTVLTLLDAQSKREIQVPKRYIVPGLALVVGTVVKQPEAATRVHCHVGLYEGDDPGVVARNSPVAQLRAGVVAGLIGTSFTRCARQRELERPSCNAPG